MSHNIIPKENLEQNTYSLVSAMKLHTISKSVIAALCFICITYVALICSLKNVEAFAGGSGTIADPYQITTCIELQAMNQNVTASYKLMNDIDCNDMYNVRDFDLGDGLIPIGTNAAPFTGRFDGQGHTISNLYIHSYLEHVGLFGVTSGARIYAVNFSSGEVSGTAQNVNIGTLVGKAKNNTIIRGIIVSSVLVSASNEGLSAGMLVGRSENSTITYVTINSSNFINIGGSSANIGGVVGFSYNATTTDFVSRTFFLFNSTTGSNIYAGGVVGQATGTVMVQDGYVDARINPSNTASYTGGIIGYAHHGTPSVINTVIAEDIGDMTLDKVVIALTASVSGGVNNK